jgi:hypothetical protein
MTAVTCERCGFVWGRDPCLHVECPTCTAPVGSPCRRPSGHPVLNSWGRFHPARDRAAAAAGSYAHTCHQPDCTCCGVPIEAPAEVQGSLFAEV